MKLTTSIDLPTLRNAIASRLQPAIGSYILPGGAMTIALNIVGGEKADTKPSDARVEGLEIVVQVDRDLALENYLANETALIFRSIITLKQWDASKTTQLGRLLMVAVCEELDLEIEAIDPVPASSAIGAIEECRFTVVRR